MNIGASLSGLFAAQTRVDVAANDIAHANPGGLAPPEQPPAPPDPAGIAEQQAPRDLTDAIPALIEAQTTYSANARVLRSQLELQGQLFDQRV